LGILGGSAEFCLSSGLPVRRTLFVNPRGTSILHGLIARPVKLGRATKTVLRRLAWLAPTATVFWTTHDLLLNTGSGSALVRNLVCLGILDAGIPAIPLAAKERSSAPAISGSLGHSCSVAENGGIGRVGDEDEHDLRQSARPVIRNLRRPLIQDRAQPVLIPKAQYCDQSV